jgi:RNA polymerase sigma factor (TIGR02999 family)
VQRTVRQATPPRKRPTLPVAGEDMGVSQPQVTMLLRSIEQSPDAAGKLLPLIYDELRAIARDRLRSERAGHTLQATALVHEAYMRLIGSEPTSWQNRAHFFGACANAMRQILVDHARRRDAHKRGGGAAKASLDGIDAADSRDADLILTVNEGLDILRAEDPRAAQVVELKFFGGLEMSEIADVLGASERTIHREWSFAKARLVQLLGDKSSSDE